PPSNRLSSRFSSHITCAYLSSLLPLLFTSNTFPGYKTRFPRQRFPTRSDKNERGIHSGTPILFTTQTRSLWITYFLSSTSTYSASITPSSFFGSSVTPSAAVAPSVGAEAADALYIASASLWLTPVSLSFAAFSSDALGVPASVLFASASALSTSVLSASGTLSPESFTIFSTLYTSESRPLRASTASRCS